jgi:hypothetical protein
MGVSVCGKVITCFQATLEENELYMYAQLFQCVVLGNSCHMGMGFKSLNLYKNKAAAINKYL